MGRGNFIPYNPKNLNGQNTFTCEFFYVNTSSNEEDQEHFYDNLKEFLESNLPKSFVRFNKNMNKQDETSFMENNLVEVVLGDNEWSIAIVIRELETNDSCRNFAPKYVRYLYKKLMKEFFKHGFICSIRTSAWTSHTIRSEDEIERIKFT